VLGGEDRIGMNGEMLDSIGFGDRLVLHKRSVCYTQAPRFTGSREHFPTFTKN
jgi:hypothetical protein